MKKRVKGQKFANGQEVRIHDTDNTGTIVYTKRKRGVWHYGVLMDRQLKAILHEQDELELV